MDIEELHSAGTNGSFCSYYYSKITAEKADVIFMPYNYITDSVIRENMKKIIKNAILVFDEAHNLDKVAEEGASRTIGTLDLKKCEDEFNELKKGLKDYVLLNST